MCLNRRLSNTSETLFNLTLYLTVKQNCSNLKMMIEMKRSFCSWGANASLPIIIWNQIEAAIYVYPIFFFPTSSKIAFDLTLRLPSTTIVPYANSLDPDETPSNSASHLDPSCLTLGQQQNWCTMKIEADQKFSRQQICWRA